MSVTKRRRSKRKPKGKADLEALKIYLKSLPRDQQDAFAKRCKTSLNYLRKAISSGEHIREALAIDIERESAAGVRVEQLRPDVDWAVVRGSSQQVAA